MCTKRKQRKNPAATAFVFRRLWPRVMSLLVVAFCAVCSTTAFAERSLVEAVCPLGLGNSAWSNLVQASDGNLYGSVVGQAAPFTNDWAAIYRLSTTGTLTTLHAFGGREDGRFPNGLIEGNDHNL